MVVLRSKQQEAGWWQRINRDGAIANLDDTTLAKEFYSAGVKTISDIFRFSAEKYKTKECLGTRRVLVKHTDTSTGKPIDKLECGDYQWLTYTQMYERSQNVGWALQKMGYKHEDRIGIFAETRSDWLIASAGILQHRLILCTFYTTLNDSGIIHALNETEVSLVFTSYEFLPRLLALADQCPMLRTLVVMEDQLEGMGNNRSEPGKVNLIPFKSFVKQGKETEKENVPVPLEDDIAVVMYTSGSTGTPKGVEITHKNILTFVCCYSDQIPISSKSRYLAFLPLAHIMEIVTEISLLANGIQVFYSSPTTLTSSSLRIFPGTDGDAKIAKPTLMNCVPLVLDRVIKSVTQKVEQQGWLKSFIFKKLVNYKLWIDYVPIYSSIVDYVIFRKVKIELGGELKTLVVGSAPLSVQTQESFQAMFGCKLMVGYGSTETSACVSVMNMDDNRPGHTGPPNKGVLLKLADWEEGGYRVTDKPNPRGEIVVGGPSVTKGYFKRPEETLASYYMENGIPWFRTGDIGEIDEQGCLKILDRLKDLVKLKHGEYISLGSIEANLKTLPIIDNVCIFADGFQERPVAVVVPDLKLLLLLAKAKHIIDEHGNGYEGQNNSNYNFLYTNHELEHCILAQIQEHGKECGLSKWEIPAALHLSNEIWNPDSGLVTAALKLRRKQLYQRYSVHVQNMFSQIEQRTA